MPLLSTSTSSRGGYHSTGCEHGGRNSCECRDWSYGVGSTSGNGTTLSYGGQFAASIQVAATSPAFDSGIPILGGAGSGEAHGGGQNWAFELLSQPFSIERGHVEISSRPGLGIGYWKSALRNTWTCGTLILPPYGVIQMEVMLSGNHPNMVSITATNPRQYGSSQ